MKKNFVLISALLSVTMYLDAQAEENPFVKYGLKKVMMATFSKGEFEEFHKNKEIVEIGSILYNTKTKEVTGYIEESIENEVTSATPAMSIDPLCEKYPWISPYAYCLNNPVRFIDPDGMDVYILRDDGKMILAKKTDDKYDQLYATKRDEGDHLTPVGDPLKVNDKGLLPQLAGGKDFATAETSNSADAFGVFKFAVDNSNVEWALTGYSNVETKKMDYVLNTNFNKESVTRNNLGKNNTDMIFDIHSHPGGNETKEASGYALYMNSLSDGPSDAEFMNAQFNAAKAANKKWPDEYPKLYIYHKKSQELYHYNHITNSQFVGKAVTPITLRSLIRNHKITLR